jgi:perosamine synthetase
MASDFIPFHKPYYTNDEINEVINAIKSGWWTTGPKSIIFETNFKNYIGCKYAVAVNSWTAAAHLALEAVLNIGSFQIQKESLKSC